MEIIASWPANAPLAGVADWAKRAERLGFDVMHVPETIHDPFAVAALALSNTTTLTVRTSMVVAFPRSPMLTAYAAWDLATFSGGRFQLGLASQVRGNIVGRYSTEWSEPVARLEDYIGAIRAIFDAFQTGSDLDYEGPHYRFSRLQPYFNPGPINVPAPQIWTGGVNRRMCELAGRVSDGFVSHPTNSHPAVIRESTLPALRAGAEAAGRTDSGPRLVAGAQPITASTEEGLQRVRDARRPELALLYSTPAYRPQLEAFGLGDIGARLSAMASSNDWNGLADHFSDDAVGHLVPQGTYEELPEALTDWYAGLCDGLVLALPAADDPDDDEALRQLVATCRDIP